MQAQMAESEETRPILEALRADRSTARERQSAMERQIKAEARRLRSGGDARASSLCLTSTRSLLARSLDGGCCTVAISCS